MRAFLGLFLGVESRKTREIHALQARERLKHVITKFVRCWRYFQKKKLRCATKIRWDKAKNFLHLLFTSQYLVKVGPSMKGPNSSYPAHRIFSPQLNNFLTIGPISTIFMVDRGHI